MSSIELSSNLFPLEFLTQVIKAEGKENFAKIIQVVKNLYDEWVNQGKTIYWMMPKSDALEL